MSVSTCTPVLADWWTDEHGVNEMDKKLSDLNFKSKPLMLHHNSHSLIHYSLHSTLRTPTVLNTLELITALLACQHTEVTVLNTLEHITSGMSTHWNHSAKHFRTEHSTSGMLQDKENDSFNHKELSSSLSVKDNTYINVLKTVKFWCFTIEHNDSISQLEWHSSACYNTQKTMHWKLWTELLVWHNTMTVLTNQSWACQFDKSINVTLKPVTKVDKCQFQSKWTESQLLQ